MARLLRKVENGKWKITYLMVWLNNAEDVHIYIIVYIYSKINHCNCFFYT